MNSRDIIQLVLYIGLLFALSVPLSAYFEKLFSGQKTFLHRIVGPIETFFYKLFGVDPNEDQTWVRYSLDLLVFSAVTFFFTFGFLAVQHLLPLNPQGLGALSPHLAFNTAVSFLSNTNWQSYGGESTMSDLSQMVPLTFQNFISASVGIAACVAVIRGVSRKESKGIGNFWADLTRTILYVLVPIAFVFAVFLISQGMIQNLLPYTEITTLEGAKQMIAQGPVASQVAIKMLGTNGGGFFNANAAHPFENPTALSNFMQMLSIFLIPSSLVLLLGRMVKNPRHGWAIWSAMLIVFVGGVLVSAHFEYQGNPMLTASGVSSAANMEGKDVRFGIFNSALFATITTDASCGAVNAMHDSFTPMGGLVPLVNMKLGEIIFGGVGSGLYGMLLFVILTVFIAGLMVGRTPEYLGKKIEGREVKYAMIAVIIPSLITLTFTALASVLPQGVGAIANPAAHGFSEIMYAYTSASQNNGSAFGGLSANVPYWNITLALCMFIGRYFVMIPMLALAGSLAAKRLRPETESTFPVHGPTFVVLLLGVIFIVGALTYLPALSLGPIVEHFQMLSGKSY